MDGEHSMERLILLFLFVIICYVCGNFLQQIIHNVQQNA